MKTIVISGVVTEGDSYRCDSYVGPPGAILIGQIDVIGSLEGQFDKPVTVGIMNEKFDGDLFIQTGWGYSEWTPMDPDCFSVGDHDLIKILQQHLNKTITLIVSDEPVNLLDLNVD